MTTKTAPKIHAKIGKHPNSLANLKPIRPGEVLNPTGKNQFSNLRGRVMLKLDERLDVLVEKLFQLAEEGDVQALRLALGSVLEIKTHRLLDSEDAPVVFRWQGDPEPIPTGSRALR